MRHVPDMLPEHVEVWKTKKDELWLDEKWENKI
jgi:hypothetical protein